MCWSEVAARDPAPVAGSLSPLFPLSFRLLQTFLCYFYMLKGSITDLFLHTLHEFAKEEYETKETLFIIAYKICNK